MRPVKLFICIIVGMVIHVPSQAQSHDLSEFLGKLKVYVERHRLKDTWSMPILQPDTSRFSMPSPDYDGFMEDPATGLQFFPLSDTIYDPETGYAFDAGTGKIYRGKRPDE